MTSTIRKSAADREPSRLHAGDPGHFPAGTPPTRLRALARGGLGEQFAVQHALARMARMTEDTAPVERHVVTVEDVTRGLGLTPEDAGRVQKLIQDTPVEFTPKTQTHRIFLAKGRLVDTLRALQVPADTRLEIARRAGAWWRKAFDTELIRRRTPDEIRWKAERPAKLVAVPPSARRLRLEWR
jgi:hypothetical protein